MNNIKIALLQLLPTGTLEGNLQKGISHCRKAKQMGADIVLFPEMWSIGYQLPKDIEEIKARAIPIENAFVSSFSRLAKKLGLAIGITFLQQAKPLPQNTLCLFDSFGQLALRYAKVHTCDFGDECNLTPGEDFYVSRLRLQEGEVPVGAMICYDREFPESARLLMLKGAEIILVPNACPMEINRLSQLRARAYENMLGLATANYPLGQPDCNGHSSVFDGIAYPLSGSGSRDTLLLEASEKEGIFMADFPIEELRAYRRREVHGNAYRRPQKYHLLTREHIEEPFIRKDYRGLKP